MDWDQLGAIAETVGAIGVIATLVYLAVQIKQNTNQLRGEAITALNNAQVAVIQKFHDRQVVGAFIKCASDWDAGSAPEQMDTHALILSYTLTFETAFNLWRSGSLSDRIYENRENLIVSALRPPGIRAWWKLRSELFDPEFVERINRKLDSEGAPDVVERLSFMDPKKWE